VTELYFTNRTSPPAQRQILKQKTIVPESLESGSEVLSPIREYDRGSSLIIVPVADGLQIWLHDESWHQAHFWSAPLRPIFIVHQGPPRV